VRSPHAHATLDKSTRSAGAEGAGVVAVLTGEDLKQDGVGGVICGWIVPRTRPAETPPHPALATARCAMSATTSPW
jgi:aerobic carbon-monoxide dehydrogenase large subunit